jgi:hypothetical protein
MALYFELTGREDLTRDATIPARAGALKGQARTQVETDRVVVKVTAEGSTEDAIITWETRR